MKVITCEGDSMYVAPVTAPEVCNCVVRHQQLKVNDLNGSVSVSYPAIGEVSVTLEDDSGTNKVFKLTAIGWVRQLPADPRNHPAD